MLLAILECIHCTLSTLLKVEESFVLLEHRFELYLVNDQDEAYEPFDDLLIRSRSVCLADIIASSPIERLAKYIQLQMDAEAEQVMVSIVASSEIFNLVKALQTLPEATIMQLQAKIKASKPNQPL